MTVAGAANGKIDYNAFEEGDGNMCTLFEEIAKENEVKGIIKMLKKYNESHDNIIHELMSEFRISEDVAEEYLEKYDNGML
jgi:hypothetical protein